MSDLVPGLEALKFSGLLAAAGLVFFGIGLLCSALLANEISAIAVSAVGVYFLFTADIYLYRWIPDLGIGIITQRRRALIDRTQRHSPSVWAAVAVSLAVTLALYRIAVS